MATSHVLASRGKYSSKTEITMLRRKPLLYHNTWDTRGKSWVSSYQKDSAAIVTRPLFVRISFPPARYTSMSGSATSSCFCYQLYKGHCFLPFFLFVSLGKTEWFLLMATLVQTFLSLINHCQELCTFYRFFHFISSRSVGYRSSGTFINIKLWPIVGSTALLKLGSASINLQRLSSMFFAVWISLWIFEISFWIIKNKNYST